MIHRLRCLSAQLAVLALAVLATPLAAVDGALTAEEREALLSSLDESQALFAAEIEGLTNEQITFRQSPERWSLGEIAEHLALVEALVYDRLTTALPETAPHPEWRADGAPLVKDSAIRMAVTNRYTVQLNAPEPLAPKDAPATAAAALARFGAERAKTRKFVESTELPLRVHFLENPVLGMMDGYQWVLFTAAHVERHTAQAREVKEDPAFSKGGVVNSAG